MKLAQGFLPEPVKLKFAHPKEKLALCFLGQEATWLGSALQGQACASAAVWRQKDNHQDTAPPNPQ